MVKTFPSAVIIFTILCLARVSTALEDNLASSHGNSSKSSTGVSQSPFANSPSSERVIRPSAWSKEENENLKPNDDKNIGNKDTLFIREEWNMKKLFQYVVTLLYAMIDSNGEFLDKSAHDVKIKMRNSTKNYPLYESESSVQTGMQNFENTDTLTKSAANGKMENSATNDVLNETPDDQKILNPPNNFSSNLRQPAKNVKIKMQNFIDNGIKIEVRNLTNPDTLNRAANGDEIQNSGTNVSLNKSSDDVKKESSSNNNNPTDSGELTENLKYKKQNSINEDLLDKSTHDLKTQNVLNNDTEIKSTSTLRRDKPKEDLTTIPSKDSRNENMHEMTFDNITTNEEEEMNGNQNYNDNKEKYDMDDVEEDDYVNENNYGNEDNTNKIEAEDDYVNEKNYENEDNTNESEVEDDYVTENNYDKDENRSGISSQSPQTEVVLDERTHESTTVLPTFISQVISNQQISSEISPPRSLINNKNNVIPEDDKIQKITKEESSSPKFEEWDNLKKNGEFIDDYINDRLRKLPGRKDEQPNNTETLITNENDAANKIISIQAPTSGNSIKKDNSPLNYTPPVHENVKDQNMTFGNSEYHGDNFFSDRKVLPTPIFSEDSKDAYPNKGLQDESSLQNIQNASKSESKPALLIQENKRNNEVKPLQLIEIPKKPLYTDKPYASVTPQEVHNSSTEPTVLDFQNNNPSTQTLHNRATDSNADELQVTDPFQQTPNKAIPLQNEDYLEQLEQEKPIVLQQDMLRNIPNQGTPNSPISTKYSIKYKPEIPVDAHNIEEPVAKMEMPSNHLISDNLQSDPSFNGMHNQESPLSNGFNKVDKIVPQDQVDLTIPLDPNNNTEKLNRKKESDDLPVQDRLPKQQILLPQSDTEKTIQESQMNNRTPSYENEINSEILPAQSEFKNVEFRIPQNGTGNSKGPPHHSLNIEEMELDSKPENETPSADNPESIRTKSTYPHAETTPEKPLKGEFQKNIVHNESEVQEEVISSSDPDSSKSDNSGESSNDDYDSEYDESSDEDYDSEYDESSDEDYDSEYDETSNEDYGSEYDESSNEDYDSEYDAEESEDYTNNLSGVMINDITMQTTQNSSSSVVNNVIEFPETIKIQNEPESSNQDENVATESPATIKTQNEPIASNLNENAATESPATFKTQSEPASFSQDGNFNTILEYVYKFSNNPLFATIRDQKNQTL